MKLYIESSALQTFIAMKVREVSKKHADDIDSSITDGMYSNLPLLLLLK